MSIIFLLPHTNSSLFPFFYYPINPNTNMKNLILTIIFSALCCIGFAQTQKTNSTKKIIPNDMASKIPLKQEKVWPVYDGRLKNPNIAIVTPPAAVITWRKL